MGNIFGDAWNATTEGVSNAADWVGDKSNAVTGAVHDIYSSATGGQTHAQQAAQERRQGAQQHAQQKLAQLRHERQGVDFSNADPAAIKQHDNWDNWNRAQLANKLKPSLKTEQINESAEAWKDLGKEITEIFADLDGETRKAAGDGMRGQAAESGMNAAKPLQDWGTKFGEAVRGTGMKMSEAGVAAKQTHDSIQEAPDSSTARAAIGGGMNAIVPGSGMIDGANQMRERQEGERQARQIVKNVYTPGYDNVDGSTPSFPKPVDPLNPPPAKSDGGGNGSGIPAGQSVNGSGSTSATPASANTAVPGTAGGPGAPGATPGAGNPSAPGNTPPAPSSNSSAWATPPGAGAPGGPGAGAPGGPGSGAPGGGGGAFGAMPPGAPGGGAPGGAAKPGAPGGGSGKPGAGGRSGVGSTPGSQGGTAAQGGGQGGGRGGGMGGAGQRGGQQGDDDEHERPSWLEENDDVWFNDMPKTAPPVLGE